MANIVILILYIIVFLFLVLITAFSSSLSLQSFSNTLLSSSLYDIETAWIVIGVTAVFLLWRLVKAVQLRNIIAAAPERKRKEEATEKKKAKIIQLPKIKPKSKQQTQRRPRRVAK